MTLRIRSRIVWLGAATVAGLTCAFPTDKSDEVVVALQAPTLLVIRGGQLPLFARAFRVSGSDTVDVKNVTFRWTSENTNVATVEDAGGGSAQVTGVNSGRVAITARAVAFEHADVGSVQVRVSNPLEIDSVRPQVVRHGQILTVYGIGVDSIFLASLAGVTLIPYPFSNVRDSATGLAQLSYWVPPPARTDSLFFLGAGVFGFTAETTGVQFRDVFEPNDVVPSIVNLDLGGPWPGTILDPVLFLNPALAFEPTERDTEGADWFRFGTTDTTRALTFFITYPSAGDTSGTRTFLLDSLYFAGSFLGRDSADFVGSESHSCKGDAFAPLQLPRESTTVALRTLPSQGLHVVTFFKRPQRYGLTVVRGYVTADNISPDRFEENDFCHFADRPAQRINLNTPFADTLTIDNSFEIDWYRIEVPPQGFGESVHIVTAARPFVVARDSSDIDVYVLTVPGSTGPSVVVVARGISTGSDESLSISLPAGSYYLAVTDYPGVATRYSMCLRVGLVPCIPPGAPPAVPGSPRAPRSRPAKAPVSSGTRDLFRVWSP